MKETKNLSKQEIEDLKLIYYERYPGYTGMTFSNLPDERKTEAVCHAAVQSDYFNYLYVPENQLSDEIMKHVLKKDLRKLAEIPENRQTAKLFMYAMKINGMDLEHVPIRHKTPEVCLQAVMSNPEAKKFVPERFPGYSNIYKFYHGKLRNDYFGYKQLSFDQVQKIFNGETVNVIGMKWANVELRDFSVNCDTNTHQINIKELKNAPEKIHTIKFENAPQKKRGVKM